MLGGGEGEFLKFLQILKFRIRRHYTTFNENFRICGTLRG